MTDIMDIPIIQWCENNVQGWALPPIMSDNAVLVAGPLSTHIPPRARGATSLHHSCTRTLNLLSTGAVSFLNRILILQGNAVLACPFKEDSNPQSSRFLFF